FGLAPSQGNGVAKALFEFDVGEALQGAQEIEIVCGGVGHDGIECIGHACEAEVEQVPFEGLARAHGLLLLRMKVSNSARDGSSRRIWLRCGCLRRTGGGWRCGVIS